MNRRLFLWCGAIALANFLVAIGGASAVRLPTSTLTVNVLSVERESSNREEIKYPGQPAVVFETTRFIAKAQITEVLQTDHGLSAGEIIDIRYASTVREPLAPLFRVRPTLSAGQTTTLTVSGGGGFFNWRN